MRNKVSIAIGVLLIVLAFFMLKFCLQSKSMIPSIGFMWYIFLAMGIVSAIIGIALIIITIIATKGRY